MKYQLFVVFFFILLNGPAAFTQENHNQADTAAVHNAQGQSHEGHDHGTAAAHSEASHDNGHGHEGAHEEFDPASTAIHHISDANVYSILDWLRIPLPMILYTKEKGLETFMSSRFHIGGHEDGHTAYNGWVMHHGSVHRVLDPAFPASGEVKLGEHPFVKKTEEKNGKKTDVTYLSHEGKEYRLDARSTLDGGILGGGITSFYDFSLTKNVLSMILVSLFLLWAFRKAAKAYENNPGRAPKGLQGLLEPIFMFIRDEVAIPFIGKDKYMKFLPLLMSIFFFILGLNLFGQIPFLGSTNVTGNLTVTMIMAVIVFLVVNFNGKRDYWQHIFWMPDVPVFVKPLLAVVEIMSLFIKPLTLMLRLAGNISAGHIAILSFIGLIFIFGKSGASIGGGAIGTAMAVPLTLFMMAIELIVAFVQAFVFTILTASYIGAAIEEHHHADHAEGSHH